jgi:hypothetical protein
MPETQIADAALVADLLAAPRFTGKRDDDLKRLAGCKVLEEKQRACCGRRQRE